MTDNRYKQHAILHLIGVDADTDALLRKTLDKSVIIETISSQDCLYDRFQDGYQPADAVLLGMQVDEPVRIAQRIHTYDKFVPIMILSQASQCDKLKRTLMFSPFLGSEVMPWSTDEIDELPSAINDAIKRRQQRVNHANTISVSKIRLEKLPLLRPEATHYLDQLLDHAPVGVLTVDLSGAILTFNRQATLILNISERNVLGRPLEEQFQPQERKRLKELLQVTLESTGRQNPDVFEIGTQNNDLRAVEITMAPMAYRTGQRGAMLILQDVTSRVSAERERKRAEDDLRFYATVLRTFHEISSDLELTLDKKLHHLLKLGCEKFRLPIAILSRIDGKSFHIQDSIGDDSSFSNGSMKSLDSTYCGATVFTTEPIAFEQASNTRWREHPAHIKDRLEAYIGVRVLVDGSIYGTLCFASRSPRSYPFSPADLEILKLMSQWVGNELQRERDESYMRKLSGALEQTADTVIITDHERRIEYVNPAFEQLTGYKKEEVIGHKTYFLRSGIHDDVFYRDLWRVIGNGGVYRGILVNKKKDGVIFHEQKTITPLKNSQGVITHFISTGHDITDLVYAEEKDRLHKAELAHVARLSTLGEMTSGLAHELNQPLCAITTYAQTCLRIIEKKGCKPEEVRYGLEQVVRQAELGSAIFRRLRDFARKDELRHQRINVKNLVHEVASFVKAELQQNQIHLKIELPRSLPRIEADPIQIEQVLLNLVRNSMDALSVIDENNRIITIKVSRKKPRSIKVCITDSGRGCPSDVADRLFEPFFTTKPNGLGIGLGISQNIIDAHGGRLWLEKNSLEGATFSFILPSTGINRDDKIDS